MVTVAVALSEVISSPTLESVWRLRKAMLSADYPPAGPAWPPLDALHSFLNHLGATATARDYSHKASLLDMAAVGGVVMESLLVLQRISGTGPNDSTSHGTTGGTLK